MLNTDSGALRVALSPSRVERCTTRLGSSFGCADETARLSTWPTSAADALSFTVTVGAYCLRGFNILHTADRQSARTEMRWRIVQALFRAGKHTTSTTWLVEQAEFVNPNRSDRETLNSAPETSVYTRQLELSTRTTLSFNHHIRHLPHKEVDWNGARRTQRRTYQRIGGTDQRR